MGCDIHWHSETKRNGSWLCDQAASFEILKDENNYPEMDDFPNRARDYWFFGFIQKGVRTEWAWSFPERLGLPNGVSPEIQAKVDYWSGDAHSMGWLTREELLAKRDELAKLQAIHLIQPAKDTKALQHHVARLNEVLANLTADVPDTDQRIIFWFDN